MLPKEAKDQFDIELQDINEIKKQDAVIIAVSHSEYINFSEDKWRKILRPRGVVIDVKSIFNKNFFTKLNFKYWAL